MPTAIRIASSLSVDHVALRVCRVDAHNGIPALFADKPRFLPIMGAPMLVIFHPRRKVKTLAQGGAVKVAIKVDPFAAMLAPGLPAIGLAYPARLHLLF